MTAHSPRAVSRVSAAAVCVLLSLIGASGARAQAARVEATVHADQAHAPISPYLYGMFLEHIGGIVNRGLWAEMLDDRKFYYPIVVTESLPARPGPAPARRWTAIGPMTAIRMDSARAFTGAHSPRITLDAAEPRGIRQAGLALEHGKSYVGRIVLAADDTARVTVTLAWGANPGDRQTDTIDVLSRDYVTYPLTFTAGSDAADAQLEITATGDGSVRVGAASLMPADNVGGFRREVVAALKSLHSGVYRFPGGNFVSAHDWRNAVGDRDRRPSIYDPVWHAVQPNDVGTDEFLTLCGLLGVEPYITVNAGLGDARSAADLVEYTNGSVQTRMGRLRALNGHPEPYHVKFWGVGNEAWGSWQFGAMSLDQFVIKNNEFADAMRAVDPGIVLIASGAMPDAMTGSGESQKRTGKIVPDDLGPADWTGGLLLHSLDHLDMISEHYYSYGNRRFDVTTGRSVPLDPAEPLVDWMRRPANHVKIKAEAYEHYLELIPALRAKPASIAMDEWAYAGSPPNGYRVVPAYAWAFHEMFRHSDLYQMAAFTFATSLLSASRTAAVLDPAGLLFKLYRDHFGTIPVSVTGNAPQSAPKYPPGGEEPKVNAGSPTYPLDVAAAWSDDRTALTVAVVNPTESERTLDLSFQGVRLAGSGTRWRMAPDSLDARIVVGETPQVRVEEEPVTRVPASPTFPPFSVTLYRLTVR
ncbi:MAG: alpha-N-arabinofuranosidase [Gemmatimonadales bacterium]